ncbi:MAG: type 4a pilus biogenesis protein PilO [Candidatus Andersenbacteria bacterium]|nr:type 4a pilus biogenesis protein PilO [Candidatus Andersenbacteria bacterium]
MASSSLQLPYLTVVGAVAIAAVFFFTVIQPSIDGIRFVQEELKNEQKVLEEKESFLRSLDRRLADLEANRAHETRLAVVLPTKEQVEDELRIIHQRATTAGLTIIAIDNVSDAAQAQANAQRSRGENVSLPENVSPLSFNVDVRGPYQGVRAFVSALERSPRLTDINYIRLTTDQAAPDQVSTRITITFYMVNGG